MFVGLHNGAFMLLADFKVNDLQSINHKNVVLFVLESPHIDEFVHRHPIAGQAGKRLLSLLLKAGVLLENSSDDPLGCQIKHGLVKNIGVINASQVPLDKGFYCTQDDTVRELSMIKKRLEKTTQKHYVPRIGLESALFLDFTARLKSSVSESTKMIIPLGHLASNFVKSVEGIHCPIHYGVNHPSSRDWDSPKNVTMMRNAVISLIKI